MGDSDGGTWPTVYKCKHHSLQVQPLIMSILTKSGLVPDVLKADVKLVWSPAHVLCTDDEREDVFVFRGGRKTRPPTAVQY